MRCALNKSLIPILFIKFIFAIGFSTSAMWNSPITYDNIPLCLNQTTLDLTKEIILPISGSIRFVGTQKSKEVLSKNWRRKIIDIPTDINESVIINQIALKLAEVLTTRTLRVSLKGLADTYTSESKSSGNSRTLKGSRNENNARGRRHRYNMIISMMFGVTALGAVLIPLGFHVLSIVSGKALLLAKMALLLASLNGLKRVAASGVHYGLYQVPGEPYSYYDRSDFNRIRNIHSPPS